MVFFCPVSVFFVLVRFFLSRNRAIAAKGPPCDLNIALSASYNEGTNLPGMNNVSVHLEVRCCQPCLGWWMSPSSIGGTSPQSLSEILPSGDFEPGCLQTVRALPGCFNAEGLLSTSTGQTPHHPVKNQRTPVSDHFQTIPPACPGRVAMSLAVGLTVCGSTCKMAHRHCHNSAS